MLFHSILHYFAGGNQITRSSTDGNQRRTVRKQFKKLGCKDFRIFRPFLHTIIQSSKRVPSRLFMRSFFYFPIVFLNFLG